MKKTLFTGGLLKIALLAIFTVLFLTCSNPFFPNSSGDTENPSGGNGTNGGGSSGNPGGGGFGGGGSGGGSGGNSGGGGNDGNGGNGTNGTKGGENFAIVHFIPDGGTPMPGWDSAGLVNIGIQVAFDRPIGRLRAMTKTGFGFEGWFTQDGTNGNWGTRWTVETQPVRRTDVNADNVLTLYARWNPGYVTVQFHTNYRQLFNNPADFPKNQFNQEVVGSDQYLQASQVVARGGTIVEPPALRTDGIHGLIGWFQLTNPPLVVTSETELNAVNMNQRWNFAQDTVGNDDITLYAMWSTFVRTVHLQVNGGLRPNGQEITRTNFTIFTGLAGSPGGRIIDPGPLVREGYTFNGWFTEAGLLWDFATSLVREVDDWDPSFVPPRLRNEVFALHARWTPNIYHVTFDSGGGLPAPPRQNVSHGDRAIEPLPMTQAGRAFHGWYLEAGFVTPWNFNWRVTGTTTLYARWEDAEYTISFHLGNPPGGLNSVFTKPQDQRVSSGGSASEPFMPALPAGNTSHHSFLGWYYSLDASIDPGIILAQDGLERNTSLERWDFNSPVAGFTHNEVLNLYARWVPPVPDMVWVPRGQFVMGDSSVSGSPAEFHAYPTRLVTIDGFFISRYPITQFNEAPLVNTNIKGFNDVMGYNPSQFTLTSNRPVERVSWFDAIEYCYRLTARPENSGLRQVYTISNRDTGVISGTGSPGINFIKSATVALDTANPEHLQLNGFHNGFRLPTEAEWEFAARGGHNSPGNFIFAGSNNPDAVAWYTVTVGKEPEGQRATQGVGRLQANALGIHDMSGNVSEWVWDRFAAYKDPYFASLDALNNPKGPPGPSDMSRRVRRGGGWSNAANNVRSVVRNADTPDNAHWVVGFRVARGPADVW